MFNSRDEGVQFPATALFSLLRRKCSFRAAEVFNLVRYIHLKFVNKYYQENRKAPTIIQVSTSVGVPRSTTHRYLQELSNRGLLEYGRGILSAPESAKMKTSYISAPLVGSIQCGSPEEE